MLLKNKVAVVTGGAAGIGRGIVEKLASEGASVVIADLDEDRGEGLVQSVQDAGGNAWFVPFDAADIESIQALAARSIELAGKVDCLVNNAAVTRRIGILDLTPDDWDWIQSINTRGLFFCLQTFARHMTETGGGQIVNISSVSGKGIKGASNASYAASKAAAIVIARIAASELGRFNINVNSVCPGPVRTELLQRLIEQDPGIIAGMEADSAMGQIADPKDIADVVAFLCSDLAKSVTGQSINVDYGLIWD